MGSFFFFVDRDTKGNKTKQTKNDVDKMTILPGTLKKKTHFKIWPKLTKKKQKMMKISLYNIAILNKILFSFDLRLYIFTVCVSFSHSVSVCVCGGEKIRHTYFFVCWIRYNHWIVFLWFFFVNIDFLLLLLCVERSLYIFITNSVFVVVFPPKHIFWILTHTKNQSTNQIPNRIHTQNMTKKTNKLSTITSSISGDIQERRPSRTNGWTSKYVSQHWYDKTKPINKTNLKKNFFFRTHTLSEKDVFLLCSISFMQIEKNSQQIQVKKNCIFCCCCVCFCSSFLVTIILCLCV